MKNLGEKIWRLRESRGLSQEALAEKLEVSRQTVSNWENGRATPDAYKLKQLCEALGVSADELLEMAEDARGSVERLGSSQENAPSGRERGRVRRGVLLAVLGAVALLLLTAAIVLFTLPEGEKGEAITSAFTPTADTGGIFLLVLAAAPVLAAAVILFRRK